MDAGDFQPSATQSTLQARASITKRIRQFFDTRDFLEVETPLLSRDTVVDRHLDPIPVALRSVLQRPTNATYYLQTSPEFCMKRLLADGHRAIYQITRVFRAGELGRHHNPEFTMLEWYRCGDSYEDAMALTDLLCQEVLRRAPAERLSYAEAFQRYAQIDPLRANVDQLEQTAKLRELATPASLDPTDRDGWLHLIFAECVQRHLGTDHPTLVYDYPASQAALARIDPTGTTAKRFELFVGGLELANGYHELLDAAELRQRNHQVNQQRTTDGKDSLPEGSRLLDAMQFGLPPCSGVAVGLDRMVMVATDAASIQDVLAFPFDRA